MPTYYKVFVQVCWLHSHSVTTHDRTAMDLSRPRLLQGQQGVRQLLVILGHGFLGQRRMRGIPATVVQHQLVPFLFVCVRPVWCSAGHHHIAAINPVTGQAICWGRNTDGQCDVPTGLPRLIAIAAGETHTAAITVDGQLVVWGRQRISVLQLEQISRGPFVMVAAGYQDTVLVTSMGHIAWYGGGCNPYSRGAGSMRALRDHTSVVAIAWKGYHGLACTPGGVFGWGSNTYGESDVPNLTTDITNSVSQVAVGECWSAVLTVCGRVTVWGCNRHSISEASGITGVQAIGAGLNHLLLQFVNGDIHGIGHNAFAQCCTPVAFDATLCVKLDGGVDHSLCLTVAANLHCWGMDRGATDITLHQSPLRPTLRLDSL